MICDLCVRWVLGVLALAGPATLSAQNISVPRDSEAVKLVDGSKTALIGSGQLSDGIVQGQYKAVFKVMNEAVFSADTKLEFLGERHSRTFVNWDSPLMIQGKEICTLDSHGETIGAIVFEAESEIRTPGQGTFTNCWSAPVWFFPAMVTKLMADDSNTAVLYRGRVSRGTQVVHVLRSYQATAGQDSEYLKNLSVREVQLDANTLLPVSIKFWKTGTSRSAPVPTTDPLSPSNNPVEVRYGNYKRIDGISVPFRVEWSNSGAMMESLSITIETVRLNMGLKMDDFSLPGKKERKTAPKPQDR